MRRKMEPLRIYVKAEVYFYRKNALGGFYSAGSPRARPACARSLSAAAQRIASGSPLPALVAMNSIACASVEDRRGPGCVLVAGPPRGCW